ncbi:MAG: (2Fe-2S)-binding protein, partial [Armatimonadetes bacterium]|nr:(2Fe-2S)-binding protein [Armatimonadota bacterium]
MKVPVTLTINGVAHALEVAPNATLLDVLRRDLGLTGAKESCLEGRCGACTVLLDGRAVNACLLLAASADGRAVTTIEGLGRGGDLHPLQQAFLEHGALQCGYCTPGMIMAGVALLASVPHPDEETIRRALHGNLCRCTGYV